MVRSPDDLGEGLMKNKLQNFLEALFQTISDVLSIGEKKAIPLVLNHFKGKELLEIGTKLTYYYFAFFLLFFGWKIPSLFFSPLSNIGDFLAGVFGPIAFGWLIIGYLMQNKELKNSVKQTSEAQRLARDQLEFQKEVENQNRKDKQKKATTLFSIIPLEPDENTKNLIIKISREVHPIPTTPSFNIFKINFPISIKTINNIIYNVKIYNQYKRDDRIVFNPILIEKISPNNNKKINLTLSVTALEELRNWRKLKIPFNYINVNGDLKKNFIIIETTPFGFNCTIHNQRVKVLSSGH